MADRNHWRDERRYRDDDTDWWGRDVDDRYGHEQVHDYRGRGREFQGRGDYGRSRSDFVRGMQRYADYGRGGEYGRPTWRGGPQGYGEDWTGGRGSRDSHGGRGYGGYGSYGGYDDERGRGFEDYGLMDRGGRYGRGGYEPDSERDYGYRSGGYGGRQDEHRGMWERGRDEASSWFGDENARRREMDDHRGRGPRGYTRSDERIREDVSDRLSDDPMVDASEIEVSVSNGEVTLSGSVASRDQRRRAEDCAEALMGVKHVQNNIRVNMQRTGQGAQGQQGGEASLTGGLTAGTRTGGASGSGGTTGGRRSGGGY